MENEVIPEVLVAVRSGEVGRLEVVDVDLVADMELLVSKAWTRTMGLTENGEVNVGTYVCRAREEEEPIIGCPAPHHPSLPADSRLVGSCSDVHCAILCIVH